jgi:hypothetical protein
MTTCEMTQDKIMCKYVTTTQCTYCYTHLLTHPNKTSTFLNPVVNIQHDGLDLDNIFIHNFIVDDCAYCQIMLLCNKRILIMVKK